MTQIVLLTIALLNWDTDLARDPHVQRLYWSLLQDSRYGFTAKEQAAFVVAAPDGTLSLVRWPESETPHRARWVGSYPDHVIAMVHTHPNWMPEPSTLDARVARQKGVPVYVVTRTKITKTVGGEGVDVISGDWKPF